MAVPKSACDTDRLHQLLSDELSVTAVDETHEHLAQCGACRTELESLAASSDDWQRWPELLRGDECDPTMPLSGSSTAEPGDDTSCRTAAIDDIVGRLSPSDNPAMLGCLGEYDILEVVGAGGTGVVLKGYDRDLNRFVAIKVLSPHYASNAAARNRFSREARAAAAVVHPHVVSIYRVADADNLPYLVMQFVPGGSLQQRIDSDAPLGVTDILRIGRQAALGLAAAHAQGLVHRDVKPANILLENGVERVMLSDFGLARAADDASMTQSGVIAGTPQYMSPEQARGAAIDPRSDLFSLGSVLYGMCTGHSPFRAETAIGALGRIYNESPRRLRQLNYDVPDWLEEIVDRLLEKSPDDRFQTAEEVAKLLGDWLAHVQQPDVVPQPPRLASRRADDPPRQRSGLWVGLIGTILALLGGVALVLEWSKGTLTIDCKRDDVAVRIKKGDRIYKSMVVMPGKRSVRIGAGEYVVELEGNHDGLEIRNGTVTLKRGGSEIVRIVERAKLTSTTPSKSSAEVRGGGSPPATAISSDEPVFRGKNLKTWSEIARTQTVQHKEAISAIEILRPDADLKVIEREMELVQKQMARERDPDRLKQSIILLTALSDKKFSKPTIEAVLAIIKRQPTKGDYSIYKEELVRGAYVAVQRLDLEVIHSRMISELKNGNSASRWFVLFWVGQNNADRRTFGAPPLEAVLAASKDLSSHVRQRAMQYLGSWHKLDERARQRLREMLEDREPAVVNDAAYLIAEHDSKYEKLMPLLDKWAADLQPITQNVAVECLKTAGRTNPAAVQRLIGLLEKSTWGNTRADSSMGLRGYSSPIYRHYPRESALLALGSLGEKAVSALPVIRKQVTDGGTASFVRAAQLALKQIPQKPATKNKKTKDKKSGRSQGSPGGGSDFEDGNPKDKKPDPEREKLDKVLSLLNKISE